MSGGRLIVVDRLGRDVKRYELPTGLATLGSAPSCDIRVMLPAVQPHHATVVVHAAQTVVRNVCGGETRVNGRAVSVAALRHGDTIELGGRALRWEYHPPREPRPHSPVVVLSRGGGGGGGRARGRRGSAGAGAGAPPDRALQLALELKHRASMPASAGGKQVAVVQPQRRDTAGRPAAAAGSEGAAGHTTQATLWIESRKPRRATLTPRRATLPPRRATLPPRRATLPPRRVTLPPRRTPLRRAVLNKAHSARKLKIVKIEAPLKIDHTKQAAIMLMTGHTPKARISVGQNRPKPKCPSFVVKRASPARQPSRRTRSLEGGAPPAAASDLHDGSSRRTSKRTTGDRSVSILEITDSTQNLTARASIVSTRSRRSSQKSSRLASPKKSAMKDHSKKNSRKTESIKFDLSNLSRPSEAPADDSTHASDEDLTLHYSDSSTLSPSPRRSIHSRISRTSDKLGSTRSPESRPSRAPETSNSDRSTNRSRSSTATVASAFRTRTLSPRNLESYSVVDLISFDSPDATKSVYDSAASIDTTDFGTPATSAGRAALGSSTPYARRRDVTRGSTRRSKSLSTPENKRASVNATRVSRASRSRSRINDSDLLLLDDAEVEDSSPRTSRRSRGSKSILKDATVPIGASPENRGVGTPENRRSPEPAGTPVLSIKSLLDSTRTSPRYSGGGRRSTLNRKSIGVLSETNGRRSSRASLNGSVRKTLLRLSRDSAESDKTDEGAPRTDDGEAVTPKSALKITPEPVKHKHSTAKKPQSKRSIIDDLDQSDIVKQLFNSPVKRKLSQSMTEFSRRRFLEDDDDVQQARRPTRRTVAVAGRASPRSLPGSPEPITPDRFVSPIETPQNSPNLSGLKRLFKKNTPENDLRNVRGMRALLRSPRARNSGNDLTDVRGVKAVFARSPRNRLSDVRIKETFAPSPTNDLRRVTGVKSVFQNASPRNDLTDVRGVKKLFKEKSPENDLRNVSGVKRTLRNTTPRNDLRDVRGVRKMFERQRTAAYHDVSGIEELFDESATRSEALFDAFFGKRPVRAVYSNTFSTELTRKPKVRRRSLRVSTDITNNVEHWLEQELQKRLHKRDEPSTSKNNLSVTRRELQRLATDTAAGERPIRTSRTRRGSVKRKISENYSAHTLPIKKRSLVDGSLSQSKRALPIKKRAVVHSTPKKGKRVLALNGSELGRVSPIAALDALGRRGMPGSTRIVTNEISDVTSAKPRTPRKQETPKKIDISKASPKRTPEKQSPPKRTTRNRKIAETSRANTKKRRSSIVITKKPPVMSPARPKTTSIKETSSKASPKKTRATRIKKEEKPVTPKRTKVRAAKATVVVTKPSPQLKPRLKGKAAEKSQTTVQEKPKRTRNTATVEAKAKSPKASPKSNRKARAAATEKAPQIDGRRTKVEKPAQTKRGRRTVAIQTQPPAQPQRGRKVNAVDTNVQDSTKTRGRKPAAVVESKPDEKVPKTRGKKVESQASAPPETTRGRGRRVEPFVEEKQTKTRAVKLEVKSQSEEIQRKTRGNKVELQTSTQSDPPARSRRTKAEVTLAPESRGRKRKATENEDVPSKVARGRSKTSKKVDVAVTETTGRQKRAATKDVKAESDKQEATKATRGRRAKDVDDSKPVEKESKPVRGRKAAESKDNVAPAARGKRKAIVEPSPAKATSKKAATRATVEPTATTKKTRGRLASGTLQPEVPVVAVGRSRRR